MANAVLPRDYPPDSSQEELESLLSAIKDYQITRGSLFKLWRTDEAHGVQSRTLGVSVYPTLFPRKEFKRALELQLTVNKLYAAAAADVHFLQSALDVFLENRADDRSFSQSRNDEDAGPGSRLARSLWAIHEEVERAGCAQYTECCILRTDYMLQVQDDNTSRLKQVEVNTIACAGGLHANRASDMHRLLARQRAYPFVCRPILCEENMPANSTTAGIAESLAVAYGHYGGARNSEAAGGTCILMVVQPNNFNIADERPIEYMLWQREPPVPCFRVKFGEEIMERTTLSTTNELLYSVKSAPDSKEAYEVAVVYYRAGLEPAEYDQLDCPGGYESRLRLELSSAIKCPGIYSHLAGFKKVQEKLTQLSVLERFLPSSEAHEVADTFVPIYPVDNSPQGQLGRSIALDLAKVKNYVLKPSLEGGGHNIYGENIPHALSAIPKDQWKQYVLMEKIKSPSSQRGMLTGPRDLWDGDTITELGVFGAVIWERGVDGRASVTSNRQVGWSLKTKAAHVNEMSVVKGFGVFDSPLLYD